MKSGKEVFTRMIAVLSGAALLLAGCLTPGVSLADFSEKGEKMSSEAADQTAERERFEFENAVVLAANGKSKISVTRIKDKKASNGYTAGSTGGKYFILKNVPESNMINIAYASPNTSTMSISIRYPGSEEYADLCVLPFSTSNSWDMDSSYIATAGPVYIPEGSEIRVNPAVDVNLDYAEFSFEYAGSPDLAGENTITADRISSGSVRDPMSPYGVAYKLEKGSSVSFTVPENISRGNVLNFSYMTDGTGKLAVYKGEDAVSELTLKSKLRRSYSGTGTRVQEFRAGEELTVTCTEGTVWIAAVTMNLTDNVEDITVGTLPEKGQRLSVILDGIWAVDVTKGERNVVPETVPELAYANSICVPGLWHCAAYDLGEYQTKRMWCKKVIELEQEPAGQVLLNIGSAQYGTYVYVNGTLAGSYEYNYSGSSTDLTGLLHKGTNELVIMLGPWSFQFNEKTCNAHVLYDGESTEDEPGITDTVTLVFNEAPDISAAQVAPDVDKGTVTAKVTLQNRTGSDAVTDVAVKIYELGTFTNGKADGEERLAAEFVTAGVTVEKGGAADVMLENIQLTEFSKEKCWTIDRPFLYRMEISTAGDTYSLRFGMRTFDFDPETGLARLNGELIYLMGTNVAIERYYDDPLCGSTPWNEEWIRKLYREFRQVGWFCFRTHLGHANSKWFDIADETGFLIFDEYPIWGNTGNDSLKTILPEIYAWIDQRGYHPSLAVFDAQNEATFDLTDKFIQKGREYDIQHRPWENGWRPPVGENDPIECHPYIIGAQGVSGIENMENKKPIVTTADIGWTAEQYAGHPFIMNEHGEYWINREGLPMSGTAGTWNNAKPNLTNQERDIYYADIVSAQLEAFRAGRAYTGLMFFCGLGSSFPSAKGVTSDILSPDVSTAESLEIRPYIKKLLKCSFAPLGITIDSYTETRMPGSSVEIPVVLINDTGAAVNGLEITLLVRSGDTVLYADRADINVPAFSASCDGLATHVFKFKVPAYAGYCDGDKKLTVQAYYTANGESVISQRKWTMDYGTVTESTLPTYSWLKLPVWPTFDDSGSPEHRPQQEEVSGRQRPSGLLIAVIGSVALALIAAGGAAAAVVLRKKRGKASKSK